MDVKLYAPLNGKKEFSGTLTAFDEETYTIELKSGSETIERKKTALIRPHIDF